MEITVSKAERMDGVVKAPPSKSYSHRAFIIASLAEGMSIVRDPLYSADTVASLEACRAFGSGFWRDSDGSGEAICRSTGGGAGLKPLRMF